MQFLISICTFVHLSYFCRFTKICLFIFFYLLMVPNFRVWYHYWEKIHPVYPGNKHGFSGFFLKFPFTTLQFQFLNMVIRIFKEKYKYLSFIFLTLENSSLSILNKYLNLDNFLGMCMQIIYIRKLKKTVSYVLGQYSYL